MLAGLTLEPRLLVRTWSHSCSCQNHYDGIFRPEHEIFSSNAINIYRLIQPPAPSGGIHTYKQMTGQ